MRRSEKGSHIAVCAFPFGSHAPALLNNALRLAEGAPAGVIFSFFNTKSSNSKIFGNRPRSTHNFKTYDVWDGVESDLPKSASEAAGMFINATPRNIMEVVRQAEAERGVKVSCLLADAFLWCCGDVARDLLGVPWIAFWIAGPSTLLIHLHTDLIRNTALTQTGTIKNPEATLDFLPGLSSLRITDLPLDVVKELESPVSKLLHTMSTKLARADAVILNSYEELEPIVSNHLKSMLQNVLHIGPSTISIPPLSKSDDHTGCLSWLDTQSVASVVYIGFGGVLVPPPNEILAIAEALDAKRIPFLWSLPDDFKNLLPNEFFENTSGIGKVVPWTPQLQVLSHPSVGVYITHCGYNSVMESVLANVPVIGRPLVGDNPVNCRLVEEVWRIGVRVEGGIFTKNGMINALDVVMCSEKGTEIRKNVGVLREQLLQTVGPNGSSTKNFKAFAELLITA